MLETPPKSVHFENPKTQGDSNQEGKDGKNEERKPGCGFAEFVTLKILLFDLPISTGDVGTDFWQSWWLIETPGLSHFGWITLAINWIPGIVAAIHCISTNRDKFGVKKTLAWSVLLIIFYPLVPPLAYLTLLWIFPTPSKSNERLSRISKVISLDWKRTKSREFNEMKYKEMKHLAMTAHAIQGGIESPLQFALQLYLIFSGNIAPPWKREGFIHIADSYGNPIYLPSSATVSLVFSAISMLKAVIELNIVRAHIEDVEDSQILKKLIVVISSHLPFLAISVWFRVLAITLFMTYLNQYGFIPILAFFLANVAIGYKQFKGNYKICPLWLISFISVFSPICCTVFRIKIESQETWKRLQYETFWIQTVTSVIIYGSGLVAILVLVNNFEWWAYDPGVIFSNFEFNFVTFMVLLSGLISVVLACSPDIFNFFESCLDIKNRKSVFFFSIKKQRGDETDGVILRRKGGRSNENDLERLESVEMRNAKKNENLKAIAGVLFSLLALGPLILAMIVVMAIPDGKVFLWHQTINEDESRTVAIIGNVVFGPLLNDDLMDLKLTTLESFKSSEKSIVKVLQNEWKDGIDVDRLNQATAVLLVDGDCQRSESTPHNYGCFRPSFKLETFNGLKTPIIRVQEIDFKEIKDATLDIILNITATDTLIQETKFNCHFKTKCLKYSDDEWLDKNTGFVKGSQTRTLKCFRRGRHCLGYEKPEETQPFCSESEVWRTLCEKDPNTLYWSPILYKWEGRQFKCPMEISGKSKCEGKTNSLLKESLLNECQEWSSPSKGPGERYKVCVLKNTEPHFLVEVLASTSK